MSRHRRLLMVVLLAGLLTLAPGPAPAGAASVGGEVEAAIMCQCGCSYTLLACASAMACDVGEEMRRVIATQLTAGKSQGEVIGYFVSLYGEKVLAAPTKKGFNLTAWITPFLALLAGGAVVYALLLAWSQRHALPGEAQARRRAELEQYATRVDHELKEEP